LSVQFGISFPFVGTNDASMPLSTPAHQWLVYL
jgi:hypothetical protein